MAWSVISPPTDRPAYTQSATEQIYVGEPATRAIVRELERTGAHRAFILCSCKLARNADAIKRIRATLGPLHAGKLAEVPAHGTRAAALAAAAAGVPVKSTRTSPVIRPMRLIRLSTQSGGCSPGARLSSGVLCSQTFLSLATVISLVRPMHLQSTPRQTRSPE